MKLNILFLLLILLLISGCAANTISQIKDPEYVGKKVAIRGTVESSFKIGPLSGYIVKDRNGDTIGVSSEELPKEGDTVIVRGVLLKDTLFGYYIKTD